LQLFNSAGVREFALSCIPILMQFIVFDTE